MEEEEIILLFVSIIPFNIVSQATTNVRQDFVDTAPTKDVSIDGIKDNLDEKLTTPIKALWTEEGDVKADLALISPVKAQLNTVKAADEVLVETSPIKALNAELIDETVEEKLTAPIKALWTEEGDVKADLALISPVKAQLNTVEATDKVLVETAPIKPLNME